MMEETQYFDILTRSQEKLVVIYSFQELVLLLIVANHLGISLRYFGTFHLNLEMDMYGSQKVF